MIEVSDNNLATQLWDAVGGGPGIAAFNASVGLTNTTPSTCVTCPNFPWPGWGLSTTTPAEPGLLAAGYRDTEPSADR